MDIRGLIGKLATPGPVLKRLEDFDLRRFFTACDDYNTSVAGTVNTQILEKLRADERFYEGTFHWLHPEIGYPRTEFRQFKLKGHKGTLQIVINTNDGRCHVDIDKYNYQDVVNIVGHLFGEVIPWAWKRRARAKAPEERV